MTFHEMSHVWGHRYSGNWGVGVQDQPSNLGRLASQQNKYTNDLETKRRKDAIGRYFICCSLTVYF
jgi:subtilisin-like proprotein convertase family protein